MEVINTTEFAPTEFLVGQQKQTRSHGVSDDPALMAMLSTGFYSRPFRTMIQEMLFNAWDAHKMVGKTDVPIDVYINETSGLIIRDYGPGIEPGEDDENIHGTYCIYGYSSKRKLPGQTGGFGLGSKSPFAYTDSFTITSFYEGTKNMYLIRRVAEDNDGKPGFTPLMSVPSEEHGLMVVIPLKSGDLINAYHNVKDLVFLSGMKINLHFKDEPVEVIDEPTLSAGEFQFENRSEETKIMAVYGGVRYNIRNDQYYFDEYETMAQFIGSGNCMYIGFAPNTMTPLPNREGLNINEKTKETIKVVLETFIEHFQLIVKPLLITLVQTAVSQISAETKDPLIALYRCLNIGRDSSILSNNKVTSLLSSSVAPTDKVDNGFWKMAAKYLNTRENYQRSVLPAKEWYQVIFKAFAYAFPDDLKLLRKIDYMGDRWKTHHRLSRSNIKSILVDAFNPTTIAKLLKLQNDWTKVSDFPMGFMIKHKDAWEYVRFERPHHSDSASMDQLRRTTKNVRTSGRKHRPAQGDRMYIRMRRNAGRYSLHNSSDFLLPKVIILAKTKEVLKEFNLSQYQKKHNINDTQYYSSDRFVFSGSYFASVIHEKNGNYDKAVKFFEDQGFLVYKCAEPVRVERSSIPKPKRPEGHPLINNRTGTWAGIKVAANTAAVTMCTQPEAFVYNTLLFFKESGYQDFPSQYLIDWYLQRHPNTVIVYSATHEKMLLERKIPKMESLFVEDLKKHFSDTKYFSLLSLMGWLDKCLILPRKMLEYPVIQKTFGIKLPKGKTLTDVMSDVMLLREILVSSWEPLKDLKVWAKDNYAYLAGDTKELSKKQQEFQLFNMNRIDDLFSQLPKEEHEAFIKKVLKTLKSF